jgi:hypothetical protein
VQQTSYNNELPHHNDKPPSFPSQDYNQSPFHCQLCIQRKVRWQTITKDEQATSLSIALRL